MIKGECLKMNCFISYRSCVGYVVYLLFFIICNGIVRLNGLIWILFCMLCILLDKDKFDWKLYVNKVVYVYNWIRNVVIGYILFELFFGWKLRFFIDLIFSDVKGDDYLK